MNLQVEPLIHKLIQSPIECDDTVSSVLLTRENSSSSFCTDCTQIEPFLTEEDHDKAFIQESTLLTENTEENNSNNFEGAKNGILPKPTSPNKVLQESENMDMTTSTEASDTSVCTVIFNGQAISSKPPLPGIHAPLHQQVNQDGSINDKKHASAVHMHSDAPNYSERNNHTVPVHKNDLTLGGTKEVSMGATELSCSHLEQNTTTSDIQGQIPKCEDLHVSLPISDEMKHMLQRIGGEKNITPVKKNMVLPPLSTESCNTEKGFVSNAVKELSLKIDNDIAQKHASPLRFPNSVSRLKGVSPIRIPKVFTALDSDDVNVRVIGRKSPLRVKPNLPIGTSLVRSDSVRKAKIQIANLKENGSTGSAENKALETTPHSNLHGPACNSILNENCETNKSACSVNSIAASTHSIFNSEKFKSLNTMRNLTSPAKPVKRLHGSPRSPRFQGKSQRKTASTSRRFLKRGTLSPIPSHIADWNI